MTDDLASILAEEDARIREEEARGREEDAECAASDDVAALISQWSNDDDAPIGLAVLARLLQSTIGWKPSTLRTYIYSEQKRQDWLLDTLLYRAGGVTLSSRRRYRAWCRAIEEKYAQMRSDADAEGVAIPQEEDDNE